MQQILSFLAELPTGLVYAILGAGAALENIVPPIPADTFVFLGGFLSGAGGIEIEAWTAYLVVWFANVASALAVYGAGYRYGRGFFEEGIGQRLLTPEHLDRIRVFYARWGTAAIFFTRFLPGLRAVVPAFAGVSKQRFLPVALPVAIASAIWYGVLVWLGATAGRNLNVVWRWIQGTNRALLGVTVLLLAGVAVWWWKTHQGDGGGEERDAGASMADRDSGSDEARDGPP